MYKPWSQMSDEERRESSRNEAEWKATWLREESKQPLAAMTETQEEVSSNLNAAIAEANDWKNWKPMTDGTTDDDEVFTPYDDLPRLVCPRRWNGRCMEQ